MKNSSILLLLLLLGITASAQNFRADTRASQVNWLGKKITGSSHYGQILLKSGNLQLQGGTIKSGKFVIDMKSMSCEDETDPRKNEKLIAHLSNEDFFAVEQHPEAVLEIYKLVPIAKAKDDEVNHFVFARLSIRGKTNDIKFPARIDLNKDLINASADFEIDRTKWDIRYGSGSFFENLGDRAINNEISFKVKIVARKQ